MKTKIESPHHSRSVNLGKAVSLSAIYTAPIKDKRPAKRRALPPPTPESAEERFAEATAGLDAETTDAIQKLSEVYGDLMICVWANGLCDSVPCRRTKTLLRKIFRGIIGPANSVDAIQFLRECLRLLFGVNGEELNDLTRACRGYAEPRVNETVNRLNMEMRSLRSTTAGTALLYALELDNAPFRESAKRLGTSAANLCQQAKRIEQRRRSAWWTLNPS